jgi:hypothetical protein
MEKTNGHDDAINLSLLIKYGNWAKNVESVKENDK